MDYLDQHGDGVASTAQGQRLRLRATLPGDVVEARAVTPTRGEVQRFFQQAPRAAPVCRHFPACGGCAVQHVPPDAYRAWQHDQLCRVLYQHGVALPGTLGWRQVAPNTRRRARLIATLEAGRVRLGLRQAHSHRRSAIDACAVLHPGIMAALPALERGLSAAGVVSGKEQEVSLTATETGLDVSLHGIAQPMGLAAREALAALLADVPLARLTIEGAAGDPPESLTRVAPVVHFDEVAVTPPPHAFLQATAASEAWLRQAVLDALPGEALCVADLFAGCGTFALPLARRGHRVHAYDNAASALAAMTAAARSTAWQHRLAVVSRDLMREPLSAAELAPFDIVVLDPPRAGAKAQCTALAGTAVERLVYVSCNPATFARDAAALIAGGYKLTALNLVDQFLWSAACELVAYFHLEAR